MKKKTQQIETNKDLSIDYSIWKKNITSKRYCYYDFNFEIVKGIAQKTGKNITNNDCRILAQALFPQYLQCGGLFDGFLFFSVIDGVRIDPPKYYYCDFQSYLNNNTDAKVNRLIDEVKDLFEKNDIQYSDDWKKIFAK